MFDIKVPIFPLFPPNRSDCGSYTNERLKYHTVWKPGVFQQLTRLTTNTIRDRLLILGFLYSALFIVQLFPMLCFLFRLASSFPYL